MTNKIIVITKITETLLTSYSNRRANPSSDNQLCGTRSSSAACARRDPDDDRRVSDVVREQRSLRHAQGSPGGAGQSGDGEEGAYLYLFVLDNFPAIRKILVQIEELEGERRELERQVNELKAKCEQIEKRAAEQRQIDDKKHQEEIQFLKRTNQQLKVYVLPVHTEVINLTQVLVFYIFILDMFIQSTVVVQYTVLVRVYNYH